MATFDLPDLGEGLNEAEVAAWLVAEGDTVAVDQVVVEVETAAKAAVEVPVPLAGIVTKLHGAAGASISVGGPLMDVEPDHLGDAEGEGGAPTVAAPTAVAVISPLVRRLAARGGIDVRELSGSGPAGVVRRGDVERALAARTAPSKKLTRSRREIPEATVWVDVDATELLAARRTMNADSDTPVSVLALVARFALLGLRAHPELNSRVEAEEIVLTDRVQLGFAAQTERGLVVPVVADAHALTTRELSAALSALIAKSRAGELAPEDLMGGTFTINNYGVFGVDGSAAIINYPEVAILGIGRIIDSPWVVDGQVTVRSVCQLTLAFDHCVCDGVAASGFLRLVADCVESPLVALAEI